MQLYRVTFGFLWVLAVASCSEPTDVNRGVEVGVSVDRAEFRSGQSIVVTVTATNRGDESVKINGKNCPPVYVVLDSNGNVVGPPGAFGAICTADAIEVTLQPGSQFFFRHNWAGEAAVGRDAPTVALPPGSYRLQGRVAGEGIWAQSPFLPIRIIP
jgi:hypothetical protein